MVGGRRSLGIGGYTYLQHLRNNIALEGTATAMDFSDERSAYEKPIL
jgi:hypothetical protein